MISSHRFATALVGLAMLVAACSGSTDNADEGSTTTPVPPTSTVASTTTLATTETATTSEIEAPRDTKAESADEVVPDGDAEGLTSDEPVRDGLVAGGGGAATIQRATFTVHETVAQTTEDETWWFTTVEYESLVPLEWRINQDNFQVELANGTRIAGDDFFDSRGDDVLALALNGRERLVGVVAFGPMDPTARPDGADLIVMANADELELRIPLEGSAYATAYPISLRDGTTSSFNTGSFPACSPGAQFDTRIDGIEIGLEGVNDRNYERVASGERKVSIDLRAFGTVVDTQASAVANCGNAISWPDFTLLVDGEPFTFDTGLNSPSIEGFGSAIVPLSFTIPASATTLELLGGPGDDVLGSWEVDLPAAIGEPEADLVPFSAQPNAEPLDALVSERSEEEREIEFATGGATGSLLLIDFEILSATSTSESGRTWLFVGTRIEPNIRIEAAFTDDHFVLVDPDGNRRTADDMVDASGRSLSTINMRDLVTTNAVFAFETDGLVEDLDGWQLQVDNNDDRPLVLPLSVEAPALGFPLGLRVGDNGQIDVDGFAGCREPLIDVTVNQIIVDIEGPGHRFQGWTRANPDHLFVPIRLLIENLSDTGRNCGLVGLFPEFLLFADGVPLNAFTHVKPNIEFGTSEEMPINFEIPVGTQRIWLTLDDVTIGEWELKDAGEVLDDFGAESGDTGTLVTLDETVLFAFGESTLQQSAFAPLGRLAFVLVNETTGPVQVTGHTDAIGGDDANQRLSEARAEAVADALENFGVERSRLVVEGAGETEPIADNTNPDGSDNPEGRQQNRRVEVLFSES